MDIPFGRPPFTSLPGGSGVWGVGNALWEVNLISGGEGIVVAAALSPQEPGIWPRRCRGSQSWGEEPGAEESDLQGTGGLAGSSGARHQAPGPVGSDGASEGMGHGPRLPL